MGSSIDLDVLHGALSSTVVYGEFSRLAEFACRSIKFNVPHHSLYRQILPETVCAMSYGKARLTGSTVRDFFWELLVMFRRVFSSEERLPLLVKLFQAVIESETVRDMLDEATARVEEDEKALKGLKSLSDEMSKLKGKTVV